MKRPKPKPPDAPKPLGGRPPHQPTDKTRAAVVAFTMAGFPQGEIAWYLDIAETTLREHYRDELDHSAMDLIGRAIGVVAQALNDKQAWAACFVLKTRARRLGWSERVEVQQLPPLPIDPAKLSDEEIHELDRILSKASGAPGGVVPAASAGAAPGGATTRH